MGYRPPSAFLFLPIPFCALGVGYDRGRHLRAVQYPLAEEKRACLFFANLGIDYDTLTMEQFANLIEVLKLSKHMNSPISQRGKGSMTHGKGKRKRK